MFSGLYEDFQYAYRFKFNSDKPTDMAFEAGFRNFDQNSHFVVQSKICVLFLFSLFPLENQNFWFFFSYKAINYLSNSAKFCRGDDKKIMFIVLCMRIFS